MKNPRIGIKDAIRMAEECGIPVRRQKDGHYLFFLDNGQIVNFNNGRNELIPPRLAVAIRRKHDNRTRGADAIQHHMEGQ